MDHKYYSFFVVSDLHYLSPALFRRGRASEELLKYCGGQLTEYGEAVIDELIRVILQEKPDGVLIPGDLTFNGESRSLYDVMNKFLPVKEAGIRIFAVPGNHDIEYPYAAAYTGDVPEPAETISPALFRSAASFCGYDAALSSDPETNSYTAELCPSVRLIALDSNMPHARNILPETTLAWAEEQLKKADAEGCRVIGMTHPNILTQHTFFERRLDNHEALASLFARYDVRLNLSGHCHLQHRSVSGDLTDISTGCLMMWPLYYGILRIGTRPFEFEYKNRTLGILQKEAGERLDETVRHMIHGSLKERDIPAEKRKEMTDSALKLFAGFIAGDNKMPDPAGYARALEDWKTYAPDTLWYRLFVSPF